MKLLGGIAIIMLAVLVGIYLDIIKILKKLNHKKQKNYEN